MSSVSPLGPEQENEQPLFHSNELTPLESISKVQDLPDGTSIFQILNEEAEQEAEEKKKEFYSNLAEDMQDSQRSGLAIKLIDEINEDKESRQGWERAIDLMLKYIGHKPDESRDVPFMRACSAFDSTLSVAMIRFVSTARAELFPATGPARSEIIGTPTDQSEDEGERVKLFMNFYLTQMDDDYYPDSEKLLWDIGFFGCAFRKVYQDPVLNKPLARAISPQNFIVNLHTNSLMSSSRMTEQMHLTRREVVLREMEGDFVESNLPTISDEDSEEDSSITKSIQKMEGINPSSTENKSLFKFYECHVDLPQSEVEPKSKNKKRDDRLPKPYVVTICDSTKKVVSVRRNWKEGDKTYSKVEYYVPYKYLTGFGIYGLGLAHLLGSNAITLTSILRQLIDAGTLKNFPGGLKTKGIKSENNDRAIGPAEWLEVETNDRPIQECIMLMPYAEPSGVLAQLRQELIKQTSDIATTAESEIPDIGANAPVGTTLAMLEVANKVQSSVLRSLHVSLGKELKLLFKLFGEYLEDKPYPFSVPGSSAAIMRRDFNDNINIVPVSDPNVLTSTHRLIRAEAILKLAQSNPQIHDMREAYKRMYSSMNIENIDKLLPEDPQPVSLDGLTENAYVMLGKPIVVAFNQDDDSHITDHKTLLQDPTAQANPQAIANMQIHIQKHKGFKALKQMIQQKQQQLEQMKQAQQQLQMNLQIQQIKAQQQANQLMMMGMPAVMPDLTQGQIQIQNLMNQQKSLESEIQQMQQITAEQILTIPEIQNMVSKNDADEINQQIQQQQKTEEENKKNQLDPNHIMLADIEQRREASILKDEEAKLRSETEAFKAQLKFESEKAKMESQENIAVENNQVDLAIEEMKHSQDQVIL